MHCLLFFSYSYSGGVLILGVFVCSFFFMFLLFFMPWVLYFLRAQGTAASLHANRLAMFKARIEKPLVYLLTLHLQWLVPSQLPMV